MGPSLTNCQKSYYTNIFRRQFKVVELGQIGLFPSSQKDVVHERDRLKMRVAVLEESVRSYEVECKASRETVMRLVSELGCERKTAASTAELLESLRLVSSPPPYNTFYKYFFSG